MGAPPPKSARAGRANPEGIPVLYCALEPKTAIIETGRFPGAVVSVRELRANASLRLADLRGANAVIERLATSNLADELTKRTLLESLGRALAEPVHPEDSTVEYVPTQYLAEVIKSAGFDGICFPSALNPKGTNIVIFDPEKIRITRRGWLFELGQAEYTVHPNPDAIIR
jgi:RES domain-containing protein